MKNIPVCVNYILLTYGYRGQLLSEAQQQLRKRLQELSEQHPCYGYRWITALLGQEGWRVGKQQIQRHWLLQCRFVRPIAPRAPMARVPGRAVREIGQTALRRWSPCGDAAQHSARSVVHLDYLYAPLGHHPGNHAGSREVPARNSADRAGRRCPARACSVGIRDLNVMPTSRYT